MKKYGFVYIYFDKKHKRYYIGCHWGFEDDKYICSSKWMKDSYKRRKEDFKKRILSRIYTNKKDLLNEEYKWLSLIKDEELGKKYYNLHNHNFNHWSANEEIKLTTLEKMSIKRKEYFENPEHLEQSRKNGKSAYEKNPEIVRNASLKAKEVHLKHPEINKENQRKLREYYKNNPDKHEENKRQAAINLKNYHNKQRETKGKVSTPFGIFDTQKEAAKLEGVSAGTISLRINDNENINYRRII